MEEMFKRSKLRRREQKNKIKEYIYGVKTTKKDGKKLGKRKEKIRKPNIGMLSNNVEAF